MSEQPVSGRLAALLQEQLDGTLTPQERAEVDEQLTGSASARRYRDELWQLDQVLRSAPAPLLPAGLHRRIVNAVRLPGRQVGWRGLVPPQRPLPYAAAAGLGALLVAGLLGHRIDRSRGRR